jgi:Arc/MetJ-type ribon-helix-helix transcriptional regulator
MKIKTSITLPEDLVVAIEQYSGRFGNRSVFIETAARLFINKLARDEQNARDLETINRQSDRLNREALDVLSYQVIP